MWDSPSGVHRLGRRSFEAMFRVGFEETIRQLSAVWGKTKAFLL
jgi:hypothetical protein